MAGKRTDYFTSDECGLTNRAFQHFRLSDLSQEYSDSILVARLIYLFIVSCGYHVKVICTMLQKQASLFSIFFYCLPEFEK